MSAGVRPALSRALVNWYRADHRDLPWRRTREPYRIWLSEVMLQQTQAGAVVPYYERFLQQFPTVKALSEAPLGEVMKAWEGLGYYARCRNLHRTAHIVAGERGGRFPDTIEGLTALPGIGRSSAGGVLTFAFGKPHPILDGNAVRVLTRVFDVDGVVEKAAVRRSLWEHSGALLAGAPDGEAFNQALMELGAAVCTRSPECHRCPIRESCDAFARGTQRERPVRKPRKPRPHHDVVAGVVRQDGRLLITQRPPDGLLGGLWELPGGRVEAEETPREALARAVLEEMGLKVRVGSKVAAVDQAYTHFRITLHAFACETIAPLVAPQGAETRWVSPAELGGFAFSRANRRVLELLEPLPLFSAERGRR